MRFRLVPKSVTLNDLERRNGHVVVGNVIEKLSDGHYISSPACLVTV